MHSTSSSWRLLTAAFCMTGLGACGSANDDAPAGPLPAAVTLAPVTWSTGVDVGTVQAVTESDQSVAVFGSIGVQTFTSGPLVGTDGSLTSWRGAAVIPSADGVST